MEAKAVVNLVAKIRADVVTALTEAVRVRGMLKAITHEAGLDFLTLHLVLGLAVCCQALAKDAFNIGFSSGTGAMASWETQLTNLANKSELVACLRSFVEIESAVTAAIG